MKKNKGMIDFESDLIELLKKYGIESKQPIESINIITEINGIPKVEINSMIVEVNEK